MIDRRKLLLLTGYTIWVGSAPLHAHAAVKALRIGILETIPEPQNVANLNAFRLSLHQLGYVEGLNILLEYRSADGHVDRYPSLATELVGLNVDLIVTRGTAAALAAKAATTTIPIVMAAIGEPLIVVSSLARPGGNVTGLTSIGRELQAKRVEILAEILPKPARIAALMNMSNQGQPPQWAEIERTARVLGAVPVLFDARNSKDLKAAFEAASRDRIDGFVVSIDSLMQANRETIAELAVNYRRPAIFASREFVEAGGLMSYGVSYPDSYRRAAIYVDKILRGAKPADLPIEQPTKFELVINLKTAKALGVTIPPTLLIRADEVIE